MEEDQMGEVGTGEVSLEELWMREMKIAEVGM